MAQNTTTFYTNLIPGQEAQLPMGTSRDQTHLAAIYVSVTATKARWLQFFDLDTLPVIGSIPRLVHYQPKKDQNLIVIYQQPIPFISGIWWASSKSLEVYDPPGVGENVVLLQAHYF